jgi:pimeloyl-ACP methyl ester carboxylesterase
MRELLMALRIPRAYLLGARSGPLAGHRELVSAGVAVHTLPDAGHNMMLDNPGGFAAMTARCLAATPQNGT